jgi:hypothetical protein
MESLAGLWQLEPKTEEELKAFITRAWEELDLNVLTKLVLSFNKRLELVINARGQSTAPNLSSHRSEPTEEDAAANQD